MKRWSGAQFWRATEFAYAILALFALTQGPVYRLWSQSALTIDRLPNPTIPHVHFASFVAVQIPALLFLARRARLATVREKGNIALLAFLCWMTLTVVWSTFSRQSFPEVVALLLTTAVGLYLAVSFSEREFWFVIAGAMAVGVGTSWIAVMRLWEGAVNFQEDYWIGIYFNRNSLAPVAAVAMIAAIGIIMTFYDTVRRSSRIQTLLLFASPVALLVYSAIELWQSKSQTSPFALLVGTATVALWLTLRGVSVRLAMPSRVRVQSAPLAMAVIGIALFLTMRVIGGFGGISGETMTFNSRRALWTLSWDGIQERPWLGWGWMAAWRNSEFFVDGVWWATWDSVWSHNGYHDVLLGGGVVAGLLFVVYLWLCGIQLAQRKVFQVVPRLLLAAYVLAAATQESFFIGSHFAWALLVAALAPAFASHSSVDEDDSTKVAT
jgi:O-antigen ligase